MDSTADAKARRAANATTGLGNLNKKIDVNTKRMAGAALAAALLPGVGSWIDDQETNFVGSLASGTIGLGGIAGGGYLGYKNAHIGEGQRNDFISDEIARLKGESKIAAKDIGPQAAVEQFAREKQAMLESIDPIDPKRARDINNVIRGFPEMGPIIAEMDIPNKSPRDIRGISKGALIGALVSMVPAYLALRSGDVEPQA